MKKYGIFLCYPPTTDLRQQGLGRYLSAFIKGAENKADIKFSLFCPSWSKDDLLELFESEGVSLEKIEIHHPKREPLLLHLFKFFSWLKKRHSIKKDSFFNKIRKKINNGIESIFERLKNETAGVHDVISLLPLLRTLVVTTVLFLCLSPFFVFFIILYYFLRFLLKPFRLFFQIILKGKQRLLGLLGSPKDDSFVLQLYTKMADVETERMLDLINKNNDISAWYCPTSFWQGFTKIVGPKLLCVPDVVLTQFPGGFSQVGGDRFFKTFNDVRTCIDNNEYFITYSDDVINNTLVKFFSINKDNVFSIKHAPNLLNQWLEVMGYHDPEKASNLYAKQLLAQTQSRSDTAYSAELGTDFSFIFYASQVRPNKNVLTLLKAYDYLLKKKFIQHKLILTGKRTVLPDIDIFIRENNLEFDVIFLHGLSVQELAACYKLADLAVNPSLSEGGCPFTFTEALSVNTPVVMGRIGVTEEVLTDPKLQEMTFFDPYSWKSMADKIEWALAHLDELRDVQLGTYRELTKRTWEDVVTEHIDVLDIVAEKYQTKKLSQSSGM